MMTTKSTAWSDIVSRTKVGQVGTNFFIDQHLFKSLSDVLLLSYRLDELKQSYRNGTTREWTLRELLIRIPKIHCIGQLGY